MNWLDTNQDFMAKPNVAWADLLMFFSIEKDPKLRKEAAKLLNLPELPEDFWSLYHPKPPHPEEDVDKLPLEKIIPKNIQRKPLQVPHFWVSDVIEKAQAPAPKALDFSKWTKQDSEEVLSWQMPFYEPLMQSQYLWTMHHKEMQNFKKKSFQLPIGKQLDINQLIKKLSVAQWPVQMPQKDLSYRAKKILVLFDWSEHLRVYKDDVNELFKQLKKQCHPIELELDSIENGPLGNLASNGKNLRSLVTPSAAALLIISDLAENQANSQNKWWKDTLKVLNKRFNHLAVLNPNKVFIKPENRTSIATQNLPNHLTHLEILLAALSPALTIEPRLIRALRLAILPFSSAELENEVWQSKDLVGNLPARQWVTPKKLEHYNNFKELDKNIRLKIAQTISDCHAEFNQLQKDEENLMAWSNELGNEESFKNSLPANLDWTKTIIRLEQTAKFLALQHKPEPHQQKLEPALASHAAYSRLSRINPDILNQKTTIAQALIQASNNNNSTTLPQGISEQWIEPLPLENAITFHVFMQKEVIILEKEIATPPDKKTKNSLVKKIMLATFQLKTDKLLVNLLGQKHIINVKNIDPILEIPILNKNQNGQLNQDDLQVTWATGSIQIKQINRPMGVLGWEQNKESLKVKIPTVTRDISFLDWVENQFKSINSVSLKILETNTQPNKLWEKDAYGIDDYGVYYDLTINGATQRFRYIPPGTFLMGSSDADEQAYEDEKPQHLETISNGFWLANTPCTQELWQAIIGNNPSHFKEGENAKYQPVESISFSGKQNSLEAFLKKLKPLLPAEMSPALPTEFEWEYACRANTNTAYWWGDKFDSNKANCDRKSTSIVTLYPPNPWGLYDMHGNVREWTSSVWKDNLADKNTKADVSLRVIRGGSWNSRPGSARTTYRSRGHLDLRNQILGLRLLLRSSS